MSDLTGFLLARIAEDEATASGFHRVLCMRIACDNDGCIWGEDEDDLMQRERVCTCGYPARVLAECEAKRHLIGLISAMGDNEYAMSGVANEMLELLALPYADHPDYRDEWKP